MNNTITGRKTNKQTNKPKKHQTLELINNRVPETEKCVSDLEDRMVEIIAMEQNKEKRVKSNIESL